ASAQHYCGGSAGTVSSAPSTVPPDSGCAPCGVNRSLGSPSPDASLPGVGSPPPVMPCSPASGGSEGVVPVALIGAAGTPEGCLSAYVVATPQSASPVGGVGTWAASFAWRPQATDPRLTAMVSTPGTSVLTGCIPPLIVHSSYTERFVSHPT